MKTKWIFRRWGRASQVGGFRWIVDQLDERQQVIPFASEAYQTQDHAMKRAEWLVEHGGHVRVVCEHAFCESVERK